MIPLIPSPGALARQKALHRQKIAGSPAQVIALSFLGVIAVGTLLLALPVSSRGGASAPLLDCLFTSTSATCVTGLVVYDTFTHWSLFGQCVILLLIQIGGLGLVSFTSFFNLIIGRKLGLRGVRVAGESISAMDLDIKRLLGLVFKTSFLFESLGAVLLSFVFVPQYGGQGVFISLFMSVSAYCNAGFDLFGRPDEPFLSLVGYSNNPFVLGVVGALVFMGGLGFIVIYDLLFFHRSKKMKITLHSRVVLAVSTALFMIGTLMTAVFEWNNPDTLGTMPVVQKLYNAMFHSVSTRTAGMNCFPLAPMHDITKVISSVLMFIGAAPGSTGGGVKCTTVAVLAMTVWNVIRGREDTIILGRRVDSSAVYKSLAVVSLGIMAVTITAGAIVATMSRVYAVTGVDAVFESVSAFATVGLSVGVTENMNTLAKCLTIFSMYIGRLGPVTFFLSLAMRRTKSRTTILPEGKIQIG